MMLIRQLLLAIAAFCAGMAVYSWLFLD